MIPIISGSCSFPFTELYKNICTFCFLFCIKATPRFPDYLHGVCFARGGLPVSKDGAVVPLQNICWHQDRIFRAGVRVPLRLPLLSLQAYLGQSSGPQHCRTAPGWCWTGTHDQSGTVFPAESRKIVFIQSFLITLLFSSLK